MAKRTIHMLIDDIDGGEAVESIKFAIDGVQYEIDLSGKNAGKMRDALAPFIEAGTKVGRVGSVVAAKAIRTGEASAEYERRRMLNGAIRSWFNALGPDTRKVIYPKGGGAEVSDWGRVPESVVEAYSNRNAAPAPVKASAAPEAAFRAPEAPAQATNGNGKAPVTRPTRTPAKRTTAATVAAAEAKPATPRKRTKAAQ